MKTKYDIFYESWQKYLENMLTPKLRPPESEEPEYDPEYPDRPKKRRTARFDTIDTNNPEDSLRKVNNNIQRVLKSDAPLNIPSWKKTSLISGQIDNIQREIDIRSDMDPEVKKRIDKKLEDFRTVLAHIQTLDMTSPHDDTIDSTPPSMSRINTKE